MPMFSRVVCVGRTSSIRSTRYSKSWHHYCTEEVEAIRVKVQEIYRITVRYDFFLLEKKDNSLLVTAVTSPRLLQQRNERTFTT